METMLKRGEVVPNFTLPSAAGEPVRRSAYRGKQHLALVFLPSVEEEFARGYVQALVGSYAMLRAASGEVLVIVRAAQVDLELPFPLLADQDGTATARFVPAEAGAGTFVLDRYGELYYAAVAQDARGLPPISELHEWLEAIDNQCAI